jgi:hypothetical protein
MGQAQSASIPSKEEILRKTKGGSNLVNELFQWMVSQASVRDFYLMANPAQCKKYIMLTANVLNQVFHKIDVLPQEGKQGTIYFRKANVLNPQDKSDPMYKHREINCLRLAFLYVRIFQIFAALSLTILDVDPQLEMKLLGDISKVREVESVPLFTQAQKGGALDSKKYLPTAFDILRGSLNDIPTNPNYYKFTGTSVYIEHGAQGPDGSLPVKYDFVADKDGKKDIRNIEGRLLVERKGTDAIAIQLYNLRLYSGSSSTELEDATVNFSRRSIEDIFRDRRGQGIAEGVRFAFQKLAKGDKNTDVDTGTSKGFAVDNGRKGRAGVTQFEKDMGEVAEGLHTKTIVSAFTRSTPPKAHCIARALQLVSDSGLQSQFPKEIYSHLCKTKFLVESRSLPPSGERVTKEDGIYALAQLFYDTLKEATPTISQSTQEQYQSFLTKMKFVFEEAKDTKYSIAGRKNPLDDVVNKIPSAICDKTLQDKTLKITNRDLIRLLRDNVRKMVVYQINHTANAVKILRKLFLLPMESGKSLQIHPRVLKYGMEEVNSIAEEARNLLVDYYSQCEILYRSGAEIIASNKAAVTAI